MLTPRDGDIVILILLEALLRILWTQLPYNILRTRIVTLLFLSFGGATSHPDLVLAHPNLLNQVTLMLLPTPGGAGHKLLVAELNSGFGRYREPCFPRWNLKKANWTRYQELTDYLEKVFHLFGIKNCRLLKNRDKAHNRAESTGMMRDCIEFRKQHTCLRRAVREAKRQTYCGFFENLDFRRDALRAHHFLSRLNNRKEKGNEPIRIADKLLTSERDSRGF
ncbi:uncharacterized protein TNCT_517401 [Trichonephila clavata]|uniref:Uncharacterized protein n=1 Tax=Trichonephila clavata TaxID=2740835 RepID=A0A8X6M0P4_TRICU|nr:uncharacterized protein TNCT_517401 [Trichonephila clavata]